MGSHLPHDTNQISETKSGQPENENHSDIQNTIHTTNNKGSTDTLQINFDKPNYDEVSKSERLTLNIKNKIASMDNEIRYLKSLLSKDYDIEKLSFINDILTRFFIKTPKLSSAGKTSSFYTDYMGRTSTQGNRTNRFSSPTNLESEEGS